MNQNNPTDPTADDEGFYDAQAPVENAVHERRTKRQVQNNGFNYTVTPLCSPTDNQTDEHCSATAPTAVNYITSCGGVKTNWGNLPCNTEFAMFYQTYTLINQQYQWICDTTSNQGALLTYAGGTSSRVLFPNTYISAIDLNCYGLNKTMTVHFEGRFSKELLLLVRVIGPQSDDDIKHPNLRLLCKNVKKTRVIQ